MSRLEAVTIEPSQTPIGAVIWLHGLGADGHDFVDIIPELKIPDTCPLRFIFPHAPIRPVTINNHLPSRAWFDIYSLSDINHQDQAGIFNMQKTIQQLIEQQHATGLAHKQILLAGFSQGGAMALIAGLSYPQQLAGICGLSCYLPLVQEFTHYALPANLKTPIFMAHGNMDPVVPYQAGRQSAEFLIQQGYPVDWHDYSMAHQVCPTEINDLARWLQGCFSS